MKKVFNILKIILIGYLAWNIICWLWAIISVWSLCNIM